jgi:hypothetical protein
VADARTVLAFATKGAGSNDEARILALLGDLEAEVYPFDRGAKARNVARLLRLVRSRRPALVVMEGTGLAGGLAVLLARGLLGTPYVISSGDSVGPFLGGTRPLLRVPGWLYEWLLCRASAGFIGWTPYLAGRAMTFGAPRAVTAAGFAQHPGLAETRARVRSRLGVPDDAIVFGIVGSLDWNEHRGYAYGLELIRAIRRVSRDDVAVVVVGDGSGTERLRAEAGADLGRRVFVPGAVPAAEVTAHLAAMDVGSLPQTLDQVGMFRYTTKISEYVSARLPIVTGRLPLAYDIALDWTWRLPGDEPWGDDYVVALATLMESLTPAEIQARRAAIPDSLGEFDAATQRERVGRFVAELLEDLG